MKNAFKALIAIGALHAAGLEACNQTTATPTSPLSTHDARMSQVNSYGHNAGLYAWSHGNTWTLVETFYDPNANYYTPNPGDLWAPSGGNGGGGPGDGYVIQDCGQLLEMITVTASGFGGGLGLYLVRTISSGIGGGGSGGTLTRSPTNFVRNASTDESVDCGSDHTIRELAALQAILTSGRMYRGLYRVNYGGGDYQMWAITAPLLSNGGIQPAGGCVGGD